MAWHLANAQLVVVVLKVSFIVLDTSKGLRTLHTIVCWERLAFLLGTQDGRRVSEMSAAGLHSRKGLFAVAPIKGHFFEGLLMKCLRWKTAGFFIQSKTFDNLTHKIYDQ